jgi:hypothetical protein
LSCEYTDAKAEKHAEKCDNKIRAALEPYKHLICEHDFSNDVGPCEAFRCRNCGANNPKWEWAKGRYSPPGDGWKFGRSADSDFLTLYPNYWWYRDWPVPEATAKPKAKNGGQRCSG